MSQEKKKRNLKRKLLHKFRLVILNEDTFEERLSFKLTRLNVFILLGISSIVLIGLTTLLIAFTSLREYIPGYASVRLGERANSLITETDSLKRKLDINEQYYASIRRVLTGDVKEVAFNRDSLMALTPDTLSQIDLNPSKEDSLLREQVNREDRYNLFEPASANVTAALFPPVKGVISQAYNIKEKHYAVDIVVPKDSPVKAAADGIVIFSAWTTETGYVILLNHGNNLITAYKHNASLNKEQGDLVKAGEVIGTVGSTGEFTTGPHLHFELWYAGYPVDPTNYIDFE